MYRRCSGAYGRCACVRGAAVTSIAVLRYSVVACAVFVIAVCVIPLLLAECSDGFFFFQAEDGIRDVAVTGVQTCALPICAAAAVSQLTAEALQALERGEPVRAGEFELQPEDVTVTREVVSDWAVQADGPYVAAVDPRLSEDLIQEGLARELVNRVQRLRKEAGYEYATRIELSVAGADDIVAAVSAFQGFVAGETLARKVLLGAGLPEADVTREVDIEARRVTIALRRHDGRKGGTR